MWFLLKFCKNVLKCIDENVVKFFRVKLSFNFIIMYSIEIYSTNKFKPT